MNTNIKTATILIGIALILTAGLLWIKETTAEPKQETKTTQVSDTGSQKDITIRYLSSSTIIEPYEFAKELGYLEGINLIREGSYTGGPEDILAVASGSTDIGHSAWVAIINARTRGSEITAFAAPMGNSPESWYKGTPFLSKWIVLENSSIKNAKDLAGKKIAVNIPGAHVDYVTREYLARNGISTDQVQFVTIGISKHEQVLKQGQVDVVAPLGVVVDKIEEGKGVRVLFSDYDIIGDQTHCVLFTSEKFLKEKPDAVRRLTEGIAKAADWAKEHPEESQELAVRILKDKGGNPDLAKYWKGFGVRDHALLADSDAQFWIDWLVKDGKIKEGQFKPADIYTNEYNLYYKK
ncbi:MAG: ABC transporter substrate-binding protein [Candidatus Methanoperedens sp.]|nr:ABC transporter substrate-binding protein [Candidatus Methanoperedens sp.]